MDKIKQKLLKEREEAEEATRIALKERQVAEKAAKMEAEITIEQLRAQVKQIEHERQTEVIYLKMKNLPTGVCCKVEYKTKEVVTHPIAPTF